MDPLLTVLGLNVGVPVGGLLLAGVLWRRRAGRPARGLVAGLVPAAAMLAALVALAWATAPSESHWLGEPRVLTPREAFRWSVFLHLAACWPGFALYGVLVALRLRGWRRAAGVP